MSAPSPQPSAGGRGSTLPAPRPLPDGRASLTARRGLVAPSATVWGLLRHELLFLSYALLEIALITPVVLVILSWARYWSALYVALWLLLVMLLPLNIIRLMGLLQWDMRRQRRVLILALLLTLLLSWRLLLYDAASLFDLGWLRRFLGSFAEGGNLLWTRDLSVFIITTLLWWRGIRLAIRHPEINNVGLRLRLGGLILLPLIIWFGSFLDVSMVPFVLLFFLAGLVTVSLVRAENIEQERSGTAATLDARWFAGVLAAAAGVVLLAGVAAAFIAGDSLFVVLAWLAPLWQALQFGATVAGVILFQITYPAFQLLAVIVQFLGNILAALLGQVGAALRQANIIQPVPTPELPTATPTPNAVVAELGGKALTVGIMFGLIILVALALARAYQQATYAARGSERSRRPESEDEEPGLGRRMLERLGLLRGWRAAASVRRIYRQMCRAAGAAGYPRLGAETPYEYLPSLGRAWPDHALETRAITEAFIRVRYGEIPETEEELEAIRAAWRTLAAAELQPHEKAASDAGVKLAKKE